MQTTTAIFTVKDLLDCFDLFKEKPSAKLWLTLDKGTGRANIHCGASTHKGDFLIDSRSLDPKYFRNENTGELNPREEPPLFDINCDSSRLNRVDPLCYVWVETNPDGAVLAIARSLNSVASRYDISMLDA